VVTKGKSLVFSKGKNGNYEKEVWKMFSLFKYNVVFVENLQVEQLS